MKMNIVLATAIMIAAHAGDAGQLKIAMSVVPDPVTPGQVVNVTCAAVGPWQSSLTRAEITIQDVQHTLVVDHEPMDWQGLSASYSYLVPESVQDGFWHFTCSLGDGNNTQEKNKAVLMSAGGDGGGVAAHQSMESYDGPSTCIACHQVEADEMLGSLHMQWSGATPALSNSSGERKGKAVDGINTFCTYALSSKGACYSCHVRADGNAPHPPEVTDIDCLMCHNDVYQRKFVTDPDAGVTITDVHGNQKTYVFGQVDALGNYTSMPDYAKMPAGTTMLSLAKNVHKPTRKSCLRCHAKAGGGDWTKRGDMGLSTVNPTVEEDVHMSPDGADLTCAACHVTGNKHTIGGRGIDLRITESSEPTCQGCHSQEPHDDSTLNRHARGQVGCQVCHIRSFAKGGSTEMARDWLVPTWNPVFCSGQGGYVGEEIRESFVLPEYVWFDGTSSVYNVGDTISVGQDGVYHMAVANGQAFDGKSVIVPIKRHRSNMALHESGKIIPPAIMWMFMTGDFDLAITKGMEEQGMTGTYTMVDTDAEMLITHGVEPKENAPACNECHDYSGQTSDGSGMIPLTKLGFHTVPAKVASCTLCHEAENLSWLKTHQKHAENGEDAMACVNCHTGEPTGLVEPAGSLCHQCHEQKSWQGRKGHKKHVKKSVACTTCHTF